MLQGYNSAQYNTAYSQNVWKTVLYVYFYCNNEPIGGFDSWKNAKNLVTLWL